MLSTFLVNNDIFYLQYDKTQNLYLHSSTSSIRVEDLVSFSCLLETTIEIYNPLLLTWNVKELITKTRKALREDNWNDKVDWNGRIYDLRYLELFHGKDIAAPKTFLEATTRLKTVKDCSLHKHIHLPLALKVLPTIELTPLKLEDRLVYSHYNIEGQVNGRLTADKASEDCFLPHTLSDRSTLSTLNDKKLTSFDYHATEVAVLQWLSKDEQLQEVLQKDDIYIGIYEKLGGKKCDGVWRALMKDTFLPVMYGMQPASMSETLKITPVLAEKLYSGFHRIFHKASGFLSEVARNGSPDYFGRKRIFEKPYQARNAVVQSAAAVFCLEKLIDLHYAGVAVNASIHDEYLVSDREEEAEEVLLAPSRLLPGLKLKVRKS